MYVPYCESSGGGDRACEAGRGLHRHVWRIWLLRDSRYSARSPSLLPVCFRSAAESPCCQCGAVLDSSSPELTECLQCCGYSASLLPRFGAWRSRGAR